jgi:DNA-binding transcriptional LysR family regulator
MPAAMQTGAAIALGQTGKGVDLRVTSLGGGSTTPFECRSPRLKLRTAACSDLLDWTSRRFAEESEFAPQVKILPVKELAWRRPIGLTYRHETYLPPAIRRFIEILKAQARNVATLA